MCLMPVHGYMVWANIHLLLFSPARSSSDVLTHACLLLYRAFPARDKIYVTQTLAHVSAILVHMLSVFQLAEDAKSFIVRGQSQTRGERPIPAQNIDNRRCGSLCKAGCW